MQSFDDECDYPTCLEDLEKTTRQRRIEKLAKRVELAESFLRANPEAWVAYQIELANAKH